MLLFNHTFIAFLQMNEHLDPVFNSDVNFVIVGGESNS